MDGTTIDQVERILPLVQANAAGMEEAAPLLAAFMPEAGVKEIHANGPDAVCGGGFAPTGTAIPVDGVYPGTPVF